MSGDDGTYLEVLSTPVTIDLACDLRLALRTAGVAEPCALNATARMPATNGLKNENPTSEEDIGRRKKEKPTSPWKYR